MSNQADKKSKRTAADYSLIGTYVSIAFIGLLILAIVLVDKYEINLKYGGLALVCWFIVFNLVLAVSFFAGLMGFAKSTQGMEKFKSLTGICLGILWFLAIIMLSFPKLSHNSGGRRTKQSEARQNLGAIFTAYTAYHSDYNTYPSQPFITFKGVKFNCLQIADWEPKGQIRYNYNCMNTEVISPSRYAPNYPCPPEIVTSATKDSFTIAACGNVDNDTTIDVWTIDDAKHLRNVVDDVKN